MAGAGDDDTQRAGAGEAFASVRRTSVEGPSGTGPGAGRLPVRRVAGRVVAVTGACSFVGRNLVGVLEEDETVSKIIVLDVSTPPTAGARTRSYRVDLTQPSASARLAEILEAEHVDVVAHLAFLSSPTTSEGWAHELECAGTMHLLMACRQAGVRQIVSSSSTLLYGPHPSNANFLREDAPLRGLPGCRFLADKIEAETQLRTFAAQTGACLTVLRMAPVLGPTVRNWLSNWLSRRWVPTAMGFDPLVQLLHEVDAIASVKTALDVGVPGVFNIAGAGVMPVSMLVTLAGRGTIPVPGPMLRRAVGAWWLAGVGEAPPAFVEFLTHLCVVEGARARSDLGFVPSYSTREAALDFGGALRLREARLMSEVRP